MIKKCFLFSEKKINFFYITIKILYFLYKIKIILADDCLITNNSKIESKWLNNIICIGNNGFRYINIASYSNGSMVIETTAIPPTNERVFYGIDNNGLPLFKNNQYHTSILITSQTNTNGARYEGEIFIAKVENDKEYVVSVGKGDKYTELYDLRSNELISQVTTSIFVENVSMKSICQFSINYFYELNNYVLFGFTDDSFFFYMKKLKFTSNDLNISPVVKSLERDQAFGKSISCFLTESKKIMCILIHEFGKTFILVYNQDFVEISRLNLNYLSVSKGDSSQWQFIYDYFMKGIHLKQEIGVFGFYVSNPELTSMITYPKILFKNFIESSSSLENYFESYSEIELNKTSFNTYCLLNDMIKINDNKLVYIGTSESKEYLYIVLMNIIGKTGITVRYYTIEIFNLYTFKFLLDMKAHLYKNFISFAFSFCRVSKCEGKNDTHFAGLMIFSYPNGTDFNLNIIDYLFTYDNLDNLQINLKENVVIENNIFGFIYSSIKIINFIDCDNIDFFKSTDEETKIQKDSNLNEDEKIKIKIREYVVTNCIINYSYIIKEPDITIFNSYTDEVYTGYGDDNSVFDSLKNTYEGKNIKYYININEKLNNEQCIDINCDLCSENSTCITCKYGYDIFVENKKKTKSCIPNTDIETTIINEIPIDTTLISEKFEPIILESEIIEKNIKSTETKIDTTEIIENNIKSTQPIIDTSEIIENNIKSTETKIDTSEINENNMKSTQPIIDTSEIIKTDIYNKTIEECSNDKIINNKCQNSKMSNEQIGIIYEEIKENILKKDYDRQNKVIQTENVIFQLSKLDEQKEENNPEVSSIDIGECENILKRKNNISDDESLIIFKTDTKSYDLSATYVQYEIYNPYNLQQLNLSDCNEVTITVNIPVNLDSTTIELYESLNNAGYNLFDSESEFYNDICTTYTSINGTDMTLQDRKNDIYSAKGNISMCQTGCELESYNKTTKKAKCNCNIQTEKTITDISKLDFSKEELAKSFLKTFKNSNFMVLKCYKLVLTFDNIFKNIGRIILSIIYFLFIISIFIHIICDRKRIRIYINEILINKTNVLKNKRTSMERISLKTNKINIKNKVKNKEQKSIKNKTNKNKKNNKIKNNQNKKKSKDKMKKNNKSRSKGKIKKNNPPMLCEIFYFLFR